MDFKTRIKEYREEKGFSSKRDFAKVIGVNENSYYMFENGSRQPSKKFLAKLALYSNLPEEFWLYGATTDKELSATREEYKMLNCVMQELLKSYKKNECLSEEQKSLILLAFEADMKHLIEKEKNKQGI